MTRALRLLGPIAIGLVLAASTVRADDELLAAMKARDFDAALALVRAGADPNQQLPDGKTPLMMAGRRGDATLVKALLAAGADVNARNANGGTALMFSAISADAQTVALLLAAGADVNAVGVNGWTALMVAAVKGRAALVRELLERAADPNAADVYGWTALMRAARRQRTEVVERLLADENTRVDLRDDDGATALHHAAEVGDFDIVRALVAHGATLAIEDAGGHTAAERALAAGHAEVADLLDR